MTFSGYIMSLKQNETKKIGRDENWWIVHDEHENHQSTDATEPPQPAEPTDQA